MKYDPNNTPDEVLRVQCLQWSRMPIGMSTYEKCQEIINKYPEHFPWEHKYSSIPKEVHDAFNLDCYPNRYVQKEWMPITEGKGLMHEIQKERNKPYEVKQHDTLRSALQEMAQVLKDSQDARDKQEAASRAEEMRVKAIWKKHYDKYGLEYRSNSEFKIYQKW